MDTIEGVQLMRIGQAVVPLLDRILVQKVKPVEVRCFAHTLHTSVQPNGEVENG